MSHITLIQPDQGRHVRVLKRICSSHSGAMRIIRRAMTVLIVNGETKICLKEAV